VIATARDTENAIGLQALLKSHTGGRLVLHDMDVINPLSISNAALAAEKLLPNGLDHLISNAGISLQPLASFDDL
jgi:NAD(P)-dependent dehydrogenase (short-subunit alcohol dehydrogenase family)